MNTTHIGDITEQKFVLRCLELEIPILKPVGNNLPYDFVIELDGKLKKIQVKTGRPSRTKDSYLFNTTSTSKNFTEIKESNYVGKIDYFATQFGSKSEDFYLIPVDLAKSSQTTVSFKEGCDINWSSYKF